MSSFMTQDFCLPFEPKAVGPRLSLSTCCPSSRFLGRGRRITVNNVCMKGDINHATGASASDSLHSLTREEHQYYCLVRRERAAQYRVSQMRFHLAASEISSGGREKRPVHGFLILIKANRNTKRKLFQELSSKVHF